MHTTGEEPGFDPELNILLDQAIALNGGRRRDALVRLAERMRVNYETVRRWNAGASNMSESHKLALQTLLELQDANVRLAKIREAVNE